ncbi:DUF2306 domain-containing protein [Leptobacterium flavescens]|uniref:DUF2306 domain-containing protein n=1 Tax=Leptobacterium flavescens TaxID=472055 RepID=A0A6P0UXP4_9FLAO|nr:DUF2306 domain-containing protein [Leptobacterium flavescens]NER15463.1 DUF2306 domain-containing protein [Leptobacterium flavescens]
MLKKITSDTGWIFFTVFAITIGLYPIFYFITDNMTQGLLASKSSALLGNQLWRLAFYLHISFGGLALLSGFSQFFRKSHTRLLKLHRNLGKLYVFSVLISAVSGFYISFYATGGLVPAMGFATLAVLWLYTTSQAYLHIRKKNIESHKSWMKRSYALCFAAVTLRLWLPVFIAGFGMEFVPSYRIIAWLCWVPNLAIVEYYIRK